jgi:hypothetical protein
MLSPLKYTAGASNSCDYMRNVRIARQLKKAAGLIGRECGVVKSGYLDVTVEKGRYLRYSQWLIWHMSIIRIIQ